jgi:hypothetical protein
MNFDLVAVLAIYAAVLSTVAILTNLKSYLRDRAAVVVEANFHVLLGPHGAAKKLGIRVTNVGRRPLTIAECGFRIDSQSPDKLLTVLDATLPKRLDEGESHVTYANPDDLDIGRVIFAWARDATGRVYRSKRRPLQVVA